jgi:hypothetical protein
MSATKKRFASPELRRVGVEGAAACGCRCGCSTTTGSGTGSGDVARRPILNEPRRKRLSP